MPGAAQLILLSGANQPGELLLEEAVLLYC